MGVSNLFKHTLLNLGTKKTRVNILGSMKLKATSRKLNLLLMLHLSYGNAFFKGAQAGGRIWNLLVFVLFSLSKAAPLTDHSATAPP